MLSTYKKLTSKRGNVTSMWMAGLPIFMIFFLLVGTLGQVWISHANSQKAADAASLAATKKMDQFVNREFYRQMAAIGTSYMDSNGEVVYINPYEVIMNSPRLKRKIIQNAVNRHQGEIKQTVKEYLEKNDAELKGKVIFFTDGRVEVVAESKLKPLILEEQFKDVTVKGTGRGPSRDYMKWAPEGFIELEID